MKTKRKSTVALIISALYIVIVLAFVISLAKEANDGKIAAEKRFTNLNKEVSRNLNSNELSSDEFLDTFLNSIGNMADIASFEIESEGEPIIFYPSSLVIAETPSSPFIHSFSTGLNTKDGLPVTFKVSIYKLKPSSIFYKGRIAFLATLCVTLFCIFYLIYLNLETGEVKVSAKKKDDDALSDEDIEDFTSEAENTVYETASTEEVQNNNEEPQTEVIDVAEDDFDVDVSYESDDADEEKSIDSSISDSILESTELQEEEVSEETTSTEDLKTKINDDNLTAMYGSDEEDDSDEFGELDDIKLPDLPTEDDTSLNLIQTEQEQKIEQEEPLEENDEDEDFDDIEPIGDVDILDDDDTLDKESLEDELKEESAEVENEPLQEDFIEQEEYNNEEENINFEEQEDLYNSEEEKEDFVEDVEQQDLYDSKEESKNLVEEDLSNSEDENENFVEEESEQTDSTEENEELAEDKKESFSEQEEQSAKPKGLFSDKTGFGWESYIIPRLDNELIRSASEEADIALFTIGIENINWETEVGKEISTLILQTVKYPDLVFENGTDGCCAVFPNTDTETAINIADELYTNIYNILEKYNEVLKIGIGISARSLRMISGSRLVNESKQALKHALEDNSSPIVAFKVNPEKYRNYLAAETESL